MPYSSDIFDEFIKKHANAFGITNGILMSDAAASMGA